jgi:hypothetical protein
VKAADSHQAALRAVARCLGPLREDVVFLGGMVVPLLLTDSGASVPRATDDVDLIVEVGAIEYQQRIAVPLRSQGFREDQSPGAPICRWRIHEFVVDVMPVDPAVFGYSNPWYSQAFATAAWVAVGAAPDERIRLIGAAEFCATKLAAFAGRGNGDFLHKDMDDFVTVVDGRPELLDDVKLAAPALRAFIASELRRHLAARLDEQLPMLIGGSRAVREARAAALLGRLQALAAQLP